MAEWYIQGAGELDGYEGEEKNSADGQLPV